MVEARAMSCPAAKCCQGRGADRAAGCKDGKYHALLWNLRVAAQLLGQSDFEESTAEGAKRFVLALTDYLDLETLKEELGAKTEDVSAIIDGACLLLMTRMKKGDENDPKADQ